MKIFIAASFFITLILVSCKSDTNSQSTPPSQPAVQSLSAGEWGGTDSKMQVGSSSTTIQFNCAHVVINEPLALDSSGRFDVPAWMNSETNPSADRSVVRVSGTVVGSAMDLTVSTCSRSNVYHLTQGSAGSLVNSCAPASSPSPSPSPTPAHAVNPGIWGGQYIDMNVNSQGATYQLDCGHGTIDQKISPDATGHFSNTGTFTAEGGPTRNPPPAPVPATFSGTVTNNHMDLVMLITGHPGSQSYGLDFGQHGTLVRCQ